MVIPSLGWAHSASVNEIVYFLRSDAAIKALNFEFAGVNIWPEVYTHHVARALMDGEIRVAISDFIEDGAGGAYNPGIDVFKIRYAFNLKNVSDQALTVHEMTHAYLDMRAQAGMKTKTCEAICYLAQATFLEVKGYDPGAKANVAGILLAAQGIARNTVVAGPNGQARYKVSAADVAMLEAEVASNPLYAKHASELFVSNGFTRTVLASLRRDFVGQEVK